MLGDQFMKIFLTGIPVEFEQIFDQYNWRIIDIWRPAKMPDRLWIFILTETEIHKYILRKEKNKVTYHKNIIGPVLKWIFEDEKTYIATFSEESNISWSEKSTRGFILQKFIFDPDVTTLIVPVSNAPEIKNLFYGAHILTKEKKFPENVLLMFDCDMGHYLFIKALTIFHRPGFSHSGQYIRKYINSLLRWHKLIKQCE